MIISFFFFFFKQKTAYEITRRDWSSDVCSSDLWLDKGLPVREATIRAMDEITGPILAITLVLSSVFLPSAFLGGITGQFFRQFALTISASMIISAINAMTMTPARAASIFAGRHVGSPLHPAGEGSGVRGHGDHGKEA